MPPRELLDTLPVYLDELAASREAASTGEPLPATQEVAATHGQTRLQSGFEVGRASRRATGHGGARAGAAAGQVRGRTRGLRRTAVRHSGDRWRRVHA